MAVSNPVIDAMLRRKSIRRYQEEMPSDDVVETIVRSGQQAPFAAQLCSLLLSRDSEKNRFHAPLLFTICVDSHKLELVMGRRGWRKITNDLFLLLLGLQDAALLAENMVIAAESLGLGSCFLGDAPYRAEKIIGEYRLPPRVFPLVQLTMGYPAEDPPPRPRYPLEFVLFEGAYPEFSDSQIEEAMRVMDEGYLAQEYYRLGNRKVPLEGDRPEGFTYDDYSWTEHMGRKWGQWLPSPESLLEQFAKCGFQIGG